RRASLCSQPCLCSRSRLIRTSIVPAITIDPAPSSGSSSPSTHPEFSLFPTPRTHPYSLIPNYHPSYATSPRITKAPASPPGLSYGSRIAAVAAPASVFGRVAFQVGDHIGPVFRFRHPQHHARAFHHRPRVGEVGVQRLLIPHQAGCRHPLAVAEVLLRRLLAEHPGEGRPDPVLARRQRVATGAALEHLFTCRRVAFSGSRACGGQQRRHGGSQREADQQSNLLRQVCVSPARRSLHCRQPNETPPPRQPQIIALAHGSPFPRQRPAAI